MEINKLQEVNPDDLDVVFRGIQLFLDSKEHDLDFVIPQLVDKYKCYQLQDHDRKLFHRFHIRISELLEKCKNQNAINYILGIRDMLSQKTSNFTVILNKVQTRCDTLQSQTYETQVIATKKQVPTWQLNSQINRTLFQFYDGDFWKLYDIMLLNKQYCSNLIVYHQSKQENIERLYAQSMERNQRIIQSRSLPIMIEKSKLEDKAQKLKFLQFHQTMETVYTNKNITMFGNVSPTKKAQVKHSISISPQRVQSRDHSYVDPDFRNMFDSDNLNLFDSNFRVTKTKNLSLHNDKNVSISANISYKQKFKSKLQQQENFSPQKGCKNQNWVLPEIRSPFQQDLNGNTDPKLDSLIKPIQILSNQGQISPDRRSHKKPPIIQDVNSTLCQQLLPQYRNNTRAFQTIRSLIRK